MYLTLCQPVDYSMTGFSVPSLSPRVCSISCPVIRSCHPTISPSVTPSSSSPQSCSSPPKDCHLQISYTCICFKSRDCSTALTFPFFSSSVEFKEEIQRSNWLHCPWGQSVFLHWESLMPSSPVALGTIWLAIVLTFLLWKGFSEKSAGPALSCWCGYWSLPLLCWTAWSASESVNNSTTPKPSLPAGSGSY